MTATACDPCLRRTDLLAALAGRIDLEWRAGPPRRRRVLALPDEALLEWAGEAGVAQRYASFAGAEARSRARQAGLVLACRCDPSYPASLRDLPDPPAVLHVLGDPDSLNAEAAAVVGARRCTAYGQEVAHALGRGMAAAGVPVVSGMALGIDSAAHAGALEARGTTVAVLGGGADLAYPASKRALHRRIADQGAVLSEMPPGFRPFRWSFPARNRIIAALGACTVVVEAAERSGSLITADFAAEAGRPVAAVPGPVGSRASAGTNALLKAGAEVVRGAQDVLDLIFGPGVRATADVAEAGLDGPARALLAAIRSGCETAAGLPAEGEDPVATAARLADLELRGLVRRTFDGRYLPAVA